MSNFEDHLPDNIQALMGSVVDSSKTTGNTVGKYSVVVFANSFHNTLNQESMKVVENELETAKYQGIATATQLKQERRNTLTSLTVRLFLVSGLLGGCCYWLKLPTVPSLVGTPLLSYGVAVVTDTRRIGGLGGGP